MVGLRLIQYMNRLDIHRALTGQSSELIDFDHADKTFIAARTKQRSHHRHRSDTRLNQIVNALLLHLGEEGKAYMAIDFSGDFLCHKRRGRF